LEKLTAYKVRPATNALPGKFETGTQNLTCQYLTDTFHRINGSFLQKESSLQYLIRLDVKQYMSRLLACFSIYWITPSIKNNLRRVLATDAI